MGNLKKIIKMIRSLFLSLFLLATCNAFAPAVSGRASTSLNDVRKVMWIGGKTQWEFEQSATYVGDELKVKGAAPKTAAPKKFVLPKKNNGLKVSSLPFGRPSVKVTAAAPKKAAPVIAKSSAVPAFKNPFAKAAPAPEKPAAPAKKGGFKLPSLKFGDSA